MFFNGKFINSGINYLHLTTVMLETTSLENATYDFSFLNII